MPLFCARIFLMKNFRKFSFEAILFFAVSVLFVSCRRDISGIRRNKDGSIELVMADVGSLDTISGLMDLTFKQNVESISNGKIKINLQLDGVLGDEESVLNLMQSRNNSIQLARISTASLIMHGAKKCALLATPYTFRSLNHFWNFANSDLAKDFLDEPYEQQIGLKGIFFAEEGFRSFFTLNPIDGIGDFAGRKILVTADPVLREIVRALNAEPVFFPTGELYVALQTGKVDGADQPLVNYSSNSFYDIAPNLILDEHTLGVTEVVITDDAWDVLTDCQRKILENAGKYTAQYIRRISKIKQENALKEISCHGVRITEVNDKSPWKEICKDITFEYAKNYIPLYEEILSMQ